MISFIKVADGYISVRHIKSIHTNPDYNNYNRVVMQSGKKFVIAPESFSGDWGYGGSEAYLKQKSQEFLQRFAEYRAAEGGYHPVVDGNTEFIKFENCRSIYPSLPTEWTEMPDYLEGLATPPSLPSAIVAVSPVVTHTLPPFEVEVNVYYHKAETEIVYNLISGLNKYRLPNVIKTARYIRPVSPVREEKNGWEYGSETYKWIRGMQQ